MGPQISPLRETERCRAGFPVPCPGQEPQQSIWRNYELPIQQKEPGFLFIPILTQSYTLTREERERCLPVLCAQLGASLPLLCTSTLSYHSQKEQCPFTSLFTPQGTPGTAIVCAEKWPGRFLLNLNG